jgi:hypothetical protein
LERCDDMDSLPYHQEILTVSNDLDFNLFSEVQEKFLRIYVRAGDIDRAIQTLTAMTVDRNMLELVFQSLRDGQLDNIRSEKTALLAQHLVERLNPSLMESFYFGLRSVMPAIDESLDTPNVRTIQRSLFKMSSQYREFVLDTRPEILKSLLVDETQLANLTFEHIHQSGRTNLEKKNTLRRLTAIDPHSFQKHFADFLEEYVSAEGPLVAFNSTDVTFIRNGLDQVSREQLLAKSLREWFRYIDTKSEAEYFFLIGELSWSIPRIKPDHRKAIEEQLVLYLSKKAKSHDPNRMPPMSRTTLTFLDVVEFIGSSTLLREMVTSNTACRRLILKWLSTYWKSLSRWTRNLVFPSTRRYETIFANLLKIYEELIKSPYDIYCALFVNRTHELKNLHNMYMKSVKDLASTLRTSLG